MQSINAAGLSAYNQVFSASSSPIIVPAATNVRGVIVLSICHNWHLGAINSILAVNMAGNSFGEFYSGLLDDNGPTGPINAAKSAVFNRPIQFNGGQDILLNYSITGTARISTYVTYRVL